MSEEAYTDDTSSDECYSLVVDGPMVWRVRWLIREPGLPTATFKYLPVKISRPSLARTSTTRAHRERSMRHDCLYCIVSRLRVHPQSVAGAITS